ncbi:MAG: hypothetical protein ACRDA5_08720 [Clostridium sp.]
MKMDLIKKVTYIFAILIILVLVGGISLKVIISNKSTNIIFIGANYLIHEDFPMAEEEVVTKDEREKYFRPSSVPIINNREMSNKLFDINFDKQYSNITISKEMLKTPEDTILNYFSLLREAANVPEGKNIGCGSLGDGTQPYKIAYKFFDEKYKEKISFSKYMKSFENIAHINLLRLKEVPTAQDNELKYFFEIETIEASDKNASYFAYYYGFINLSKEGDTYKISNIDIYGENYLCTPYHGWSNDATSSVEIKYGNWCNLVKKMGKTESDGFEKKVYFEGNDNKEYMIVFYTLTNDNDIEIAQYSREQSGAWVRIELDPNKCIKDR